MQAYQADMSKFEATETLVFGISMDSSPANKRFAEDIKVTFPLLSDWKRKTTKDYGLYNEETGYGARATFVVDKEGKILEAERLKRRTNYDVAMLREVRYCSGIEN